jgi:hypothetical protein
MTRISEITFPSHDTGERAVSVGTIVLVAAVSSPATIRVVSPDGMLVVSF